MPSLLAAVAAGTSCEGLADSLTEQLYNKYASQLIGAAISSGKTEVMCVSVCVCARVYMCVLCMHVHASMCEYVYLCVCEYVYMCVCECVYLYVYMCVCEYVYLCM